jgi:hypothetical protein
MSVTIFASVSFEADSAEEAQAVVAAWDIPAGASVTVNASETITQGTVDDNGDIVGPPTPPTATELDPASAKAGAADVTMHVRGAGFTDDAVITFNGADEATTVVDDGDVSTVVKVSGEDFDVTPGEYPVSVRASGLVSNMLMFTIEPAAT